jgi:DMSO/TMAO reductase YedYZ molybdopterin-dependent catalytic subunit
MQRRQLIAGAGAAVIASPAGAGEAPIPAGLPDGTRNLARLVDIPGKIRLIRLVDRPPNYATPADAFSDVITPNDRFFVRYHLAGVPSAADMDSWSLSVGGDAVERPVRLKLSDLQGLPVKEVLAVCQCAGNRRGFVDPHVAGVEWPDGGMGCAVWRGPALHDVLNAAGVKSGASEVWIHGADKPALEATPAFRKSIPIDKALDAETIVAISMNNMPLPLLNGFPARLVVPGWTGTYWMKHLTNIEVSQAPLKNFWMQAAYRVPAGLFPVEHPFTSQVTATTAPITELVVNSVIADPPEEARLQRAGFTVGGVAWDRGAGIKRVEVSLDGGQTWQDAVLDRAIGPYAYRRFSLQTGALAAGTYRLMSRATSMTGEQQAERLKVNPGGYHNNVPRPIQVVVA